MSHRLLHTVFIGLVGMYSTNLFAQKGWVDPDFVLKGLPFTMSKNPCGLLWMNSLNLSQAKLGFIKNNGGLVNYHESDDDFEIKAEASSIFHFNEKIILRGEMSYSFFEGKHMSGSSFIDPYTNAFNITEFDDSNQGKKKLERYHILAEVGYNLYKGWVIGGSFDLVSANYSKMKDLRHSNTLSDIKADIGLAYEINPSFSIGASYHYSKSIEDILFRRYSIAEKHYDMLISAGSFWGKRKSYDEHVGMISTEEKPVINKSNGGTLQLQYRPSDKILLFLDGGYSDVNGSYGIKSPTSIEYLYHTGKNYLLNLNAVLKPTKTSRHIASLKIQSTSRDNYENVFKETVNDDFVNEVTYHDAVFIGSNDSKAISTSYRYDWNIIENQPLWSADIKAQISNLDRKGESYPYFRKDCITTMDLQISGKKSFLKNKDRWSFGLSLDYHDGLKDQLEDGSYLPNPTQVKPKEADIMLHKEREFFGKPQLGLSPSISYSRQFKKLTAFAEGNYSFKKSLEKVAYLSDGHQHTFQITLGLIL